jgi:hypothetical protein
MTRVFRFLHWRWSILALFNWLGLIKLSGTLFIFVYRYLKFKIVYFDIKTTLLWISNIVFHCLAHVMRYSLSEITDSWLGQEVWSFDIYDQSLISFGSRRLCTPTSQQKKVRSKDSKTIMMWSGLQTSPKRTLLNSHTRHSLSKLENSWTWALHAPNIQKHKINTII